MERRKRKKEERWRSSRGGGRREVEVEVRRYLSSLVTFHLSFLLFFSCWSFLSRALILLLVLFSCIRNLDRHRFHKWSASPGRSAAAEKGNRRRRRSQRRQSLPPFRRRQLPRPSPPRTPPRGTCPSAWTRRRSSRSGRDGARASAGGPTSSVRQ